MRPPCPIWLLLLCSAACEANQTHPADTAPYEAGTIPPLSCVPNLDGVIQSSELQPSLGVAANYLVSAAGTSRPVDVTGSPNASGQLVWDWSASYASDRAVTVTASGVPGKWYAASFPGGQFVTAYDAGHTLEAIYAQDDKGLYLLGLASTEQSPPEGQTLYIYQAATPITLYTFPLKVGTTWSSTGTVQTGSKLRGLPYSGTDRYEGADVATGQLALPDFTFSQAHRLTFVVTVTPSAGGSAVVQRQDSFLFECFGEVGRATSAAGETHDNFTTAAEQRRLGM